MIVRFPSERAQERLRHREGRETDASTMGVHRERDTTPFVPDGEEPVSLAPVTPLYPRQTSRPRRAESSPRDASTGAESFRVVEMSDSQSDQAREFTRRLLAKKDYSRAELDDLLQRAEVSAESAHAELDRCEQAGEVDDNRLAAWIVRTSHERKGRGRSAVENELYRRRIPADIVEQVMKTIDDDAEHERAKVLVERRLASLGACDDESVRRRLSGFLARRGYTSSVVRSVINEVLAARTRMGVRFH